VGTESSGSKPQPRTNRPRPRISVLRIGHRAGRDPRLTTHAALTARAFGAERLYLHPPDDDLGARIAAVGRRWGGSFAIEGVTDWRHLIREFDGAVVHLTMYGLPLDRMAPRIRTSPHILLVVGGAKVPSALYQRATYNVAVGSQPHSEVAALALTLDRLLGPPPPRTFRGAEIRIRPTARGKRVVEQKPSG